MTRNLSDIERFIKKEIKKKLESDLKRYRILKEADLQSCFYFHLRKYLGERSRWRVYSEKSTPHGNYVDLVIYDGREPSKPRIAIELKWNRKRISSKDRKSLNVARKKLKVNKTYFVTTNIKGDYQRSKRRKGEKYRLHEVVIKLSKSLDSDEWLRKRERIKKIVDISGLE